MELQGQAKKDFLKYVRDNYSSFEVRSVAHCLEYGKLNGYYSYAVDFFDSVGIIIKDEFKHRDGFNYSISYRNELGMNPYKLLKGELSCVFNRDKARKAAKEKAVIIYNERNK